MSPPRRRTHLSLSTDLIGGELRELLSRRLAKVPAEGYHLSSACKTVERDIARLY